jgi:hypothetical protein
LVGAAFKALSSDEIVKYKALAKQDKKRYEREMAAYEPPEADSDDDSDAGDKGKSKGSGKKAKKKKDPNAPKVSELLDPLCLHQVLFLTPNSLFFSCINDFDSRPQ